MVFSQKVSERLLRPWQCGIPQTHQQMALVLAAVKPALALLKATLSSLIDTRGPQVKNF